MLRFSHSELHWPDLRRCGLKTFLWGKKTKSKCFDFIRRRFSDLVSEFYLRLLTAETETDWGTLCGSDKMQGLWVQSYLVVNHFSFSDVQIASVFNQLFAHSMCLLCKRINPSPKVNYTCCWFSSSAAIENLYSFVSITSFLCRLRVCGWLSLSCFWYHLSAAGTDTCMLLSVFHC